MSTSMSLDERFAALKSLDERFEALMKQHELMFGKRPNPGTLNPRRCFKCQGLGHMPTNCPNKEIITLAQWKAAMEEENEEKNEDESDHELEETQEEVLEEASEEELLVLRRVPSHQEGVKDELEKVMVEADEGDMLTIDTHPPPKGKENRSVRFLSLGQPSTFFPTPPTPKALNPNFCQVNSEPLLTTPNLTLRVSENVVHGMFKESLTSHTQISKGHEEKRASKTKGKLFAWLILFQPSREERRGGNYLT